MFAISVDPSDRALHLNVKGGHRVVVIGYLGEPVLRDNGREVAVNLASPTAAAAGLLVTSAEKNESGTAVWRDPRLRQLTRRHEPSAVVDPAGRGRTTDTDHR